MDSSLNEHSRTYSDFSSILDYSAYEPLPDDWLIGITDVVDSGSAIRRGAYEDVNYAGVSVIAAVGNSWGSYDFPFTFGGDGAAFALPAEGVEQATGALRQVAALAETKFGLTLRAGLLRVSEIRAHGHDVRVARYAASSRASFSMFAGGGLKWAERELKKGRYAVEAAAMSPKPDLKGLSCDWLPIPNRHGMILSLLVEPTESTSSETFAALARRILAIFDASARQGHPLPEKPPTPKEPNRHVDDATWLEVALHSDFKKYDDVLRLTLDCSEEQAVAAEIVLKEAAERGEINFGMHRQSHAVMTCLVPAASPQSHLHFLDGQDGGYSKAAEMLNRMRSRH
ncbi:DUF3095 family protein [Phyllobacterium lublinensis]|uniref:DUF3095 family protein n=1 Tax=Phyllobacterium lublinensis TaxID=2875708 RepID=UPI001CCF14B9|nr:DUF3095 family protein [Phyllobacterium sp. 2063]MBZ9656225.1 DUF3095 domain-containing protein [Phyllobacterium sp. 2063]